ncbi:antitoxin Xre-like helix-turn-helix domain-containing protein [Halomonas koreensis]|uniref:Antitoxin Xre-like helix-turn-helix domain-containing protein n=1 Tax=Halomonas koreensis TaxID=245385 RepID=A0ABU1FZP2_9GAMM|nr:antitoxin Xre-like helix-turn-helix domain-containing protein [Halomonas koreensis]MDR5865748.1 hypothetical protein [Halomonas koreensis]
MLDPHSLADDRLAAATGLKTAVRILDRWGASGDQVEAILRVSHSTCARARNGSLEAIKLDRDQLARLSYVLNIHAALRIVFDNPENLYGFMGMANHNAFFGGRPPLEVLGGGDFAALYESFKRIDALRGGGW